MHKSPEALYDEIMHRSSPWDDKRQPEGMDQYGSMFSDGFRGQAEAPCEKPKNVEVVVECTLKEMYCGSVRKVDFCRQEIHHAPKTSQAFQRQKQIEIKPGFSEETVLTFKGEGNAAYNQPTSDLVIRFHQIKHPSIKRSGNDLVMTVPVSLQNAIAQTPVTFTTLDGRSITVSSDQQISP